MVMFMPGDSDVHVNVKDSEECWKVKQNRDA